MKKAVSNYLGAQGTFNPNRDYAFDHGEATGMHEPLVHAVIIPPAQTIWLPWRITTSPAMFPPPTLPHSNVLREVDLSMGDFAEHKWS